MYDRLQVFSETTQVPLNMLNHNPLTASVKKLDHTFIVKRLKHLSVNKVFQFAIH